ncbi:MAG: hypothetical protein JW737_04030, partial [Acidobacteria bacterium]|nr:hypothetical protein [Acidobacteriota bacterium]
MRRNINGLMLTSIFPDILAFGIGLSIALFLRWNTADLVWSLWLSSLFLGYLTILSAIGGTVYTGIRTIKFAAKFDEFPKDWQKPALIIGSAVVLFMFVFFSFHFCGFHAGHAIFLSHFFPVEGMTTQNLFGTFMNPLALWKKVFKYLLP